MPNRPVINEGRKAKPCYIPSTDEVEMPGRDTFRAEWRFFKTLFHELAHSTGHQSRLARKTLLENKGMASFGTEAKTYFQEELVAEMTAAFLGAHAGIIEDDFENSAAYLKSWLDVLKVSNHKKWLVQAASEAQKAANYILNTGQGTGAA
jgi:antirestriction protein ArdC